MNCELCEHRVKTVGDGVCDRPVGFGPDGECPLEINLCDTCVGGEEFPGCDGMVQDVEIDFGKGTGGDNIIGCECYEEKDLNLCDTCIQRPPGDCDGMVSDVPLILGTQSGPSLSGRNIIGCESHKKGSAL